MAPIRKGDGTGLAATGYSQVRKGDGTVLWNAIPDSGDLHARFDATQLSLSDGQSVSTWGDETGNGHDLTAGTAPTYRASGINGNPVVEYDGADDFLDVTFSTLAQPNTTFVVMKLLDTSNDQIFITSADDSNRHHHRALNGDTNNMFAGSNIDGNATTTNAEIQARLFDGANSIIRRDGSQEATGDAGTEGFGGLTVGSGEAQSLFANIQIGEILIYPQDKSGIFADVEQYLSDKWGITI